MASVTAVSTQAWNLLLINFVLPHKADILVITKLVIYRFFEQNVKP